MEKRVHIFLPQIDGTWFTQQAHKIKDYLNRIVIKSDIRPMNAFERGYKRFQPPPSVARGPAQLNTFLAKNKINAGDVLYFHFGDLARRVLHNFPKFPCRVFVHCHGYDVGKTLFKKFDYYSSFQDKVDAFIVPSSYLGGLLEAHGVSASKIVTVQYGVDAEYWKPRKVVTPIPQIFSAVTVNRLVAKKRVIEAMQSFAAFVLGKRKIDPHFTGNMAVVGAGLSGDTTYVQRAALDLNGQNAGASFYILGQLKPEEIRNTLRCSHVYIACNARAEDGDTDGSPISWLEALSCGIPVIAPGPLGSPKVLLTTDGTVPDTVRMLHATYDNLIEEPQAFKNYCRNYVLKNATWKIHCDQIVDLLTRG